MSYNIYVKEKGYIIILFLLRKNLDQLTPRSYQRSLGLAWID